MVRGSAWLGVLVHLGLAACSSPTPGGATATLRAGLASGGVDPTDAAVMVILRDNRAACTGTLIAPNLVVTARSCVADLSTGDGPIDCETSTFGAPYEPATLVLSSDSSGSLGLGGSAFAREVRVPDGASICGNDIALLILAGGTNVAPIWPRLDPEPQPGEGFMAVGFGPTYPPELADGGDVNASWRRNALPELTVGCVGPCEGSRATETEWIGNSRVCEGDTGGPALDLLKHLIGVASRPEKYCIGGLYASLASWARFIVDTANDAAEIGGYDPPLWTQALPAGGTSDPGVTDGGAGAAGEIGSGGSSGTHGLPSGGGRASGDAGSGDSAGPGEGAASGGHSNAGHAGSDGSSATPGAAGDSAGAGAPTDLVRPTRPTDAGTARHSGCSCRVGDERSSEARLWHGLALLLAGSAFRRRKRT